MKKQALPMKKCIAFNVDEKMKVKLNKLMKKLKLKSISETIRMCIENFKG